MSTDIFIRGGQSENFNLEEYGLIVDCPCDALPVGLYAKINIRLSISGPYVYPNSEKWRSATPVYWISSSIKFHNQIQLGIRHYARGKANSSVIKVFTADDTPKNNSYVFKEVSNVTVDKGYAYFSVSHFSSFTCRRSASEESGAFSAVLFEQKSNNHQYLWEYSFIVYCFDTDILLIKEVCYNH